MGRHVSGTTPGVGEVKFKNSFLEAEALKPRHKDGVGVAGRWQLRNEKIRTKET